jgi:hypothetical protein
MDGWFATIETQDKQTYSAASLLIARGRFHARKFCLRNLCFINRTLPVGQAASAKALAKLGSRERKLV